MIGMETFQKLFQNFQKKKTISSIEKVSRTKTFFDLLQLVLNFQKDRFNKFFSRVDGPLKIELDDWLLILTWSTLSFSILCLKYLCKTKRFSIQYFKQPKEYCSQKSILFNVHAGIRLLRQYRHLVIE